MTGGCHLPSVPASTVDSTGDQALLPGRVTVEGALQFGTWLFVWPLEDESYLVAFKQWY